MKRAVTGGLVALVVVLAVLSWRAGGGRRVVSTSREGGIVGTNAETRTGTAIENGAATTPTTPTPAVTGRPGWAVRWGTQVGELGRVMGVVAASRSAERARAADPEAARVETMRDLFEVAQDLYGERDYEGAYLAFMDAYDVKPAVSLLYNAAVCREKQGQLLDAMDLFQRYLDESPGGARDRERVEDRILALAERAL